MTTEAQSPPDITILEDRAVSVLESADCLTETRVRIEDRAARHLTSTFMLAAVGVHREWISREYWQAKSWVRIARKQFVKGYSELFPYEPLAHQECTEVARAVLELCSIKPEDFSS